MFFINFRQTDGKETWINAHHIIRVTAVSDKTCLVLLTDKNEIEIDCSSDQFADRLRQAIEERDNPQTDES